MTDWSKVAPLNEGEGGETGRMIELGPATRKQLEAVLGQAAGGLLAVVIEASGYELDGGWALTIERATLTRSPAPQRNGVSPHPHPSLSEAT